MSQVFKFGVLEEKCSTNPCTLFRTEAKSNYKATIVQTEQALKIIQSLVHPLHRALVIVACLSGLRASELAGLLWAQVQFERSHIDIDRRWSHGQMGKPKSDASAQGVTMGEALASILMEWRSVTPYHKNEDFVFASFRREGRMPITMSNFVCDHLRPAAISAGVVIKDGQRFGLHNLRHSLSNWLVNKGKVRAKTVQGLMRHSKIQTTLDLYAQSDSDEMSHAQGLFAEALGQSGQSGLGLSVSGGRCRI
jgi:integrase